MSVKGASSYMNTCIHLLLAYRMSYQYIDSLLSPALLPQKAVACFNITILSLYKHPAESWENNQKALKSKAKILIKFMILKTCQKKKRVVSISIEIFFLSFICKTTLMISGKVGKTQLYYITDLVLRCYD